MSDIDEPEVENMSGDENMDDVSPSKVTKIHTYDPELPDSAIDVSTAKNKGVMKVILTPGKEDVCPTSGDTVSVHYVGTLYGGDKHGDKFDSSRDRGSPFEFKLGEGQVIKAWDQGVASMKKGEVSELYCSPDFAYGAAGSGSIPANATLKFEVELLSWKGEDLSPEKNGSICRMILHKGQGYQSPSDGASVNLHVKIYTNSTLEHVSLERDFRVDVGDVTAEPELPSGVHIAVTKMKKEEVSRFTFKPPHCNPGHNTEQVVDVTLKSYEKLSESWELHGAKEKLTQAELMKVKGTEFFKKNKFHMAEVYYKKAVSYLDQETDFKDKAAGKCCSDDDGSSSDEHDMETSSPSRKHKKHEHKHATTSASTEQQNGDVTAACDAVSNMEKRRVLMTAVQLNLALNYLKRDNHIECIHACNKALEFEHNNEKALFRRGLANVATHDYDAAKLDFVSVLKIDANNKAAQTQLKLCIDKLKEQRDKDKKTFFGMFDKFAKHDAENTKPVIAEQHACCESGKCNTSGEEQPHKIDGDDVQVE